MENVTSKFLSVPFAGGASWEIVAPEAPSAVHFTGGTVSSMAEKAELRVSGSACDGGTIFGRRMQDADVIRCPVTKNWEQASRS